jgi:hypothetical protein
LGCWAAAAVNNMSVAASPKLGMSSLVVFPFLFAEILIDIVPYLSLHYGIYSCGVVS